MGSVVVDFHDEGKASMSVMWLLVGGTIGAMGALVAFAVLVAVVGANRYPQ